MVLMQRAAARRYVLAAVAVALVLAGALAYFVTTATPDECTPEARQAALQQDTRDVLAGRIRLDVAYANEQARIEHCGS